MTTPVPLQRPSAPPPDKTFGGVLFCWRTLTADLMAREMQREFGTLATIEEATGVRAELIAAANGVAWTTPDINDWVILSGGRWLGHVEGTPRVEGSPTGGWAVFTVGNSLFIPCSSTTGEPTIPAEVPENVRAPVVDDDSNYWWWMVLVAALGTGVYLTDDGGSRG